MKIVLKMDNNLSKDKTPIYHVRQLGINKEQVVLPKFGANNSSSNSKNNQTPAVEINMNNNQPSKPVIERGASWSYNETRVLLGLWGQDLVQRQLTNSKRTRKVWELIAERINELGYKRTAEQVRTRVFNMIAEYRRILKNPTPERIKKCCFFNHLARIYQAKDVNGVKAALNNDYDEEYQFEPIEFNGFDENEENMNDNELVIDNSTNSEIDDKEELFAYDKEREVFSYEVSPSHFNSINSFNSVGQSNGHHIADHRLNNNGLNFFNMDLNGQNLNASLNSNVDLSMNSKSTAFKQPSHQTSQTNSINGDISDNHSDQNSTDQFNFTIGSIGCIKKQINQHNSQPQKRRKLNNINNINAQNQELYNRSNQSSSSNNFATSSPEAAAFLIDKMFGHLARSTDAMIEWVRLEQNRLEQDAQRRKDDIARDERRERKFIDAMVKIQEMQFDFLSKHFSSANGSEKSIVLNNFREQIHSQLDRELHKKDTQTENCKPTDSSSNRSYDNVNSTIENEQPTTSTVYNEPAIDLTCEYDVSTKNSTNLPTTQPIDNTIIQHNQTRPSSINHSILYKNYNLNNSLLANKHQTVIKSNSNLSSISTEQLPDDLVEYVIEDIVDDQCNNFDFSNVHHEEVV